ncbi:MAG TPA: GNVR domain-containing protein [Pyrinomonadaceae bacterium]|nr:GNVR domain-containing protein [Pyrinomonadaceae bacterium]
MSVEFRQRKPGEYARILWRRKWMILLPAVAVALAFGWAVWKLPNVFEATTLLTVRPPSISPSIVPQLSNDDLSVRINTIGQQVVSRTSLQPLIEKYGLYAVERHRGEPMDSLVERMRTRDISVRVNTTRNDITNGFYLSFRGSDPRTTQAVTAELASKYTKAQTQEATNDATQTKEFFEGRLEQARQELDTIDKLRLDVMMRNRDNLPETSQALIGQLAGLREEQKSLGTSLDLLRQRRASLMSQKGDIEKRRTEEIDLFIDNIQDPKTTPAYASLVTRREHLRSEKERLLTEYRPKHPDVIAKQAEIENVQRDINEMVADYKQRVEERRKRLEGMSDPREATYRKELEEAESQLSALQKRQAANDAQIADVNRRLGGLPGAVVELQGVEREYQTKKAVYDELLKKSQQADLVAGVQANAQGESIQVIDGANLPERPVAPKRPALMLLGLLLGLGFGLACAAAFEVPKLLTIQTTEDAEHYTGLPVLVSLPNMLTPREERRLKMRRTAFALAGLAAAVVSVPALYAVLRLTRVLEMFAFRG